MFCFSFSCADLLHGNCLLTGFNISINILLAKKTFLFLILLCYLLNISTFCIDSISWCCFVVTLFHCTSHVPLFCGLLIVLPVFRCSASILVFRSFVFPCSWFYSMPLLTASASLEYASFKTKWNSRFQNTVFFTFITFWISCFTSKKSPSTIRYTFL